MALNPSNSSNLEQLALKELSTASEMRDDSNQQCMWLYITIYYIIRGPCVCVCPSDCPFRTAEGAQCAQVGRTFSKLGTADKYLDSEQDTLSQEF